MVWALNFQEVTEDAGPARKRGLHRHPGNNTEAFLCVSGRVHFWALFHFFLTNPHEGSV